jgi:hypothetical protein
MRDRVAERFEEIADGTGVGGRCTENRNDRETDAEFLGGKGHRMARSLAQAALLFNNCVRTLEGRALSRP